MMSNLQPLGKVNCDLCDADDFRVVYHRLANSNDIPLTDMYGAAKSIRSIEQIVKCNQCGFVYTNPRIRNEILDEIYKNGQQTIYLSQTEWKILTFLDNLKWVESFIPTKDPQHNHKRILDVGAASGLFMHIAKQNGWEAYGVEPNVYLAEYAKNKFHLTIYNDPLERASLPNTYFDAITMLDVIEHLSSPRKGLTILNKALVNGGYLFIVTPNLDCLFSKILRRRWWFIMAHHLYYFTPRTIRKMLVATGFEVIDIRNHSGTWETNYLANMMKSLNRSLPNDLFSRCLSIVASAIPMKRISMYAGQMKVIARKVGP